MRAEHAEGWAKKLCSPTIRMFRHTEMRRSASFKRSIKLEAVNESINIELAKHCDKRITNEQTARDKVRKANKQKKYRNLPPPSFPSRRILSFLFCPSFHHGPAIIMLAAFSQAQSSLKHLLKPPFTLPSTRSKHAIHNTRETAFPSNPFSPSK